MLGRDLPTTGVSVVFCYNRRFERQGENRGVEKMAIVGYILVWVSINFYILAPFIICQLFWSQQRKGIINFAVVSGNRNKSKKR